MSQLSGQQRIFSKADTYRANRFKEGLAVSLFMVLLETAFLVRAAAASPQTGDSGIRGTIQQSDWSILQAVEDALRNDARVNAANPNVSVVNGAVSLSGVVDTLGQKVRAENIASQLEGVLTLENRIHVTPDEKTASDSEIRAAIEDQILWSPYVDSDRITVTVANGRALLKGEVANRFVGRIVVQNAFEGGAQTVQTQLALNDGGTFARRFLEKPAHLAWVRRWDCGVDSAKTARTPE